MPFRAAIRVLAAALTALAVIPNPASGQTLGPPAALSPKPGGQVRAAAWSPAADGIVLTGTNAGGLGVWSQAEPPALLVDRPDAHESGITAIVFRPPGPRGDHQFLTASLDRSARLWSIPGQQVRAFVNTDGVDLAVSDKNLIAFGATVASVKSVVVFDPFDPAQARPSGTVAGMKDVVSVAWLRGDWLASADATANILLWQKTGSTTALTPGAAAVTAPGVSLLASDEKHVKLVSAGVDGSLRLWTVAYDGSGVPTVSAGTPPILVNPPMPARTIAALAVNVDGTLAATADSLKAVQIVPTDGTTAATPVTIPTGATPLTLRFIKSGAKEVLLIGLDTGSVLVSGPSTPATAPVELVKAPAAVTAIAYGNTRLLVGPQGNDCQVFQYDPATAPMPVLGRALGTEAKAVAPVVLGGLPLFVVRGPGTAGLSLWQTVEADNSTAPLTTIATKPTSGLARIHGAAWSNNGRRAFFGLADGRVRQWNEANGVTDLIGNAATVLNAVAFSPDTTPSGPRFLATAGDAGSVAVWNPLDGKQRFMAAGHTESVLCLGYQVTTPFNLASGSADRSVRVWDATTGKAAGGPWVLPGFVQAVAFSPANNTWLASGDSKGNVFVIDVTMTATGPLAPPPLKSAVALPGNAGVLCLAWSPDGGRLVAGTTDGNAYIIHVGPP